MGRPLSRKYFGRFNTDIFGNFSQTAVTSDAELGGQPLQGILVGTAGTYTSASLATLTFPTPLLAVEGAVTATGTPTYTAVSATVGGTQTKAYLGGAGNPVVSNGATFTPTLTAATSGVAVSAVTNTAGVITVASGTYVQGQDFVITTTVGGTTLPSGTYYVAVGGTSVTSITVASSYANAVAATPVPTTFSTTGSVTATGVLGGTYNTIATVTVAAGSSFTTLAAGAQATTQATSSGAGATFTITYGLLGVTFTAPGLQGDGYLAATVGTAVITATTAPGAGATSITSTIAGGILTVTAVTGTILPGMILTGGSVTAGAYIVSQLSGTTGGNGTYQLGINNAAGQIATPAVIGAISGTPTTGTLNAITVTSTVDMVPGMTFTPATTTGGLTGSTVYYIQNVISPTQLQVSSTLGSFTAVTLTTTSATSVNAPFGQYSTVTVGGSGSGTATIVRATANTSQVGKAGSNAYSAIQATAFLPKGIQAYSESDIVMQKGTRRYKVENDDGVDVCQLVAPTTAVPLSAGQMSIQATDSAGGTYWVTKLTKNGAVLTQNTGTQFATGQKVIWTMGTAVANSSVQIDNA